MLFSNYKIIMELCGSLQEALEYMQESQTSELTTDCILAVNSITDYINADKDSVKSDGIFYKAEQIKNMLTEMKNGISYQIDDLVALSRDFCDALKSEINVKLKVLFVAELGSKWDSMESVYNAMKNRSDCEVQVVLQPIFRAVKQSDGSVRKEEIYEDYLTPMGIEHISYKNYSFEKEAPDMTFISQPYESVTIPMFWPENIVKYSKLVFLPYYTALTLYNRVFSAGEAFFDLNVQKYAWKIACQSDTMAGYYRGIASEKGKNVVVSGLPKWDHVVNAAEAHISIPETWQKKLEGKKVFLWNTHFSTESSPSDILNKGVDFIKLFKNNKDAALIWRPHPMTETVIKTYMPGRLKDYIQLKRMVESADNMVMDTNTSYLPAFYCADALISDYSSLIEQYLFMNKPILMLVKHSIANGRREYITVDDLFDFSKIPFASTIAEQKEFIDAIISRNDVGSEDRNYLLNRYFSLADGKCGERFADIVIKDYIKDCTAECGDLYFDNNKTVIVGPYSDSQPCIKQLMQNGTDFCMVREFLADNEKVECEVISETELSNYSAELVVITDRKAAESIRQYLLNKHGLDRARVILFWNLYNYGVPLMLCDRVMQNPQNEEFEGIIIGGGNAKLGIITEQLKQSFCNLSVVHQDLYYQCKTLEYCLEAYPEKLKDLKYAVVELDGYSYFNYDVSTSAETEQYLSDGGFNLDAHNYAYDKNKALSFESTVEKIYEKKLDGINDMDLAIWQQVFPDVYECAEYEGFDADHNLKLRTKFVDAVDLKNYNYNTADITSFNKNVIQENIDAFTKLLQILRNIAPEIKIYAIVVPKYIEIEALSAYGTAGHKHYFLDIVKELQSQFDFSYIDFRQTSDISSDRSNYYDAEHLNYFGALRFTEHLNNAMFGDTTR